MTGQADDLKPRALKQVADTGWKDAPSKRRLPASKASEHFDAGDYNISARHMGPPSLPTLWIRYSIGSGPPRWNDEGVVTAVAATRRL